MVKEAKKEKKINPFLPVLGLTLAVMMGIISFFAAPFLLDLFIDYYGEVEFNRQLGDVDRSFVEYGFMALMFFSLFGIVMFIVAAAIGEDPEDEQRLVRPREGDVKAMKKWEAKQAKIDQRRMRRADEIRKRNAKK